MQTNKPFWVLNQPLDAIVFDCDSTLSHIEGIDELAKYTGMEKEVAAITNQCMNSIGLTPEIYAARLDLVKPTLKHVDALADNYATHLAPDASTIIAALQRLGKSIYVVSGGIYQAIWPFCVEIGIPKENVFAVNLYFDSLGNYHGFDETSPLIKSNGKLTIIEKIKQRHSNIAMVGDGITDYYTIDVVKRFIGYGGLVARKTLQEKSPFYILKPTFLPLLPLCLTDSEYGQLNSTEKNLYTQGLTFINNGDVTFQENSYV